MNSQLGSAAVSSQEQPGAGLEWCRRWQQREGRALRVLHLGNIANNAFNNARIQRQYGIDAYAIAYENYHIMACPEWEEATFEGDIGDPFFPDWTKVDLGGYVRPKWFASGPLELCCSMVAAEVTGRPELANQTRRSLDRVRQAACSRVNRFAQRAKRKMRRSSVQAAELVFRLGQRFLGVNADPEHERLLAIWKQASIPGSAPKAGDFASYRSRLAPLTKLFAHFDVVQAYSIDGAWPLLAHRSYVAYEHGTLRDIPFQDDSVGRLAATVYLGANHVLVTNIDCLAAANRLGIPSSRITPLPHAFDDKRLVEFANRNSDVKPPDDCVVFFHPARHDWRDADPSMVKGNDRLVRAFASVSRENPQSLLVMVAWGRDLDASRDLIRSLGLQDKVRWLDPMRKPKLWRTYLSSHAVLDQFVLPSFGGVTFEALALGRRVVTNVDFAAAEEFFSKAPPILSASTEDEIADALRKVIADRNDDRGIGKASSDWIQHYHSAERVVELQLQAYQRLIGAAG